jgi:integrase/recombinase XerD
MDLKLKFTAYERKNRKNVTITGRIYTDKGKKEFSTPYIISPQFWNKDREEVLDTYPNYLLINSYLFDLKSKFNKILVDAYYANENLNIKQAEKRLNALPPASKTCVEYFEIYNERRKLRSSTKDMLQKYKSQLKNLKDFLRDFYKDENLKLQDLKSGVLGMDMMDFFEKTLKHSRNYARKLVQAYQKFFTLCKKQEYHKEDLLIDYILPKPEKRPFVTLTLEEVKKLEVGFGLSEHLRKVADCFLFQCYSGFGYSDLKALRMTDLKTSKKGQYFEKPRGKTSVVTLVPLFPEAKALLEKYDNDVQNLYIICNPKYNSHLKTIGLILDIPKEKMKTHIARKTFANLKLNGEDGDFVSLEVVSKMIGHSNTKVTQQAYAQVNPNRILDETKNLRNNKK